VEQAIREAGMQARVRLLGRIPHQRVLQEMAWADVFALAGWDEPFGQVFSEALSVGCPIIYARDGGIADVVRDGVHGIAVEPKSEESAASALQTLLANEPERRSMGVAARALFEKQLLWDHHAIQMKSVFGQAASVSADAH
jgi:glycosyltransferase involved in cell wall biosynthesis